jgi:hypothetical protein
MRLPVLLLLLVFGLTGCANTPGTNNAYTLYLVRHAEKQSDDSRDPLLTAAGKHRAEQLAIWFQDKDIRDIWSSDFHRTRDTAGPALDRLGLKLKIYQPGELDSLSELLLKKRHNAAPDLARLLCRCTIHDMDDSEYDQLIEISITGGETQVKTLQQSSLF